MAKNQEAVKTKSGLNISSDMDEKVIKAKKESDELISDAITEHIQNGIASGEIKTIDQKTDEKKIEVLNCDLKAVELARKQIAELEAKIASQRRITADLVEAAKSMLKKDKTLSMFNEMHSAFKKHEFKSSTEKQACTLTPEEILALIGTNDQKTFGSNAYTISDTCEVRFSITFSKVEEKPEVPGV